MNGKILTSGHSTIDVEGKEIDKLRKNYTLYVDGIMKCNPGNIIMPSNYRNTADLIHDFDFTSTDTVVNTFPRSGTTWTQEIVWNLIKNPDGDNMDINKSIHERFPQFDSDVLLESSGIDPLKENNPAVQLYRKLYPDAKDLQGIRIKLAMINPHPRLLKSRVPLSLLAADLLERCKVIYVAREVRDVVNSLYYFMKLSLTAYFKGDKDEFVDDFINDRIIYCPYYNHLKIAWDLRHHPNMLFIFYEDLKADPVKSIKEIDAFLGTKRTDKQIQTVSELTSFSALKEKTKENYFQYYKKEETDQGNTFFRKGLVGDWKNNLTEAQGQKLTAWAKTNMKVFGPEFKYANFY